MHNTREFSYESCGQAFIGCPSDAERYEELIQEIWQGLPVPGVRRNIMHWKKDYDAFASKGAEPDQYKIAKTSDPATNPVFILFAHKIGTSVRPPSRDTGDWDTLRDWLNRKGWGRIAMLGDADFQDEAQVPEGKIPLSGTLYELFDAMRTGNETDLRIYDLRHIAPSAPAAEPGAGQQAKWCEQLLNQLSKNFAVRVPRGESEFEENAEEDLRLAFEVPRFDPLTDPLPGLDAISSKTPLLFGRGGDIERLSDRVFQGEQAAFTNVVGVSGAGKSSLMRGGLMREWFRASPSGPGRRMGATALLVEPQLLQLDDAADPLETLARLLTTAPDKAPDRVVGPLPGLLASQPPPLAPPGDDLKKDLPAAIRWWAALTEARQDEKRQGPLVLILDQAEQIEAAARRAAQAEAERTGQSVAPKLSPQWRRFTGLFAALSGVLDPAYWTPELDDQIEEVNRRRPLRLLLTLHRESALDLWPLKETLPEPEQVAPLTTQAEWRDVIEGTCRAYGLTLDEGLRKSMVDEAVKLADKPVSVREADDAPTSITHTQASVLPQVRTALQRIITRWRELHEGKNERKKLDKAAYTLDAETFAPRAGIAGAIEALGEEAWQDWQAALAESTATNRASIFGQQELAQEQNRRFADLMSGLVDARNAGQQDLSKLLRGGERAQRHKALVEALLTHRMLTKAGENKDQRYLLLSHRSVLAHWQRAAKWLEQAEPRLKVKARLVNHYQQEDRAEDRWHKGDLNDFAHLAINWIGSGEEKDGQALAYLKSGLCARLDPAQVGLRAETRLARLPFTALYAGDTDFFGSLLHKCMISPAWPDIAPGLVLAISAKGEVEFLKAVLKGDDNATLCNTVDGKTGAFPLLLAAQNGHDKAVALLLAKGADPNRIHKDGGFPLLLAAQNGHDQAVATLLEKGADPDRVHKETGAFPLLQAAQNGHDQAVAMLLDQGAEPNRVDEKDGAFPLLLAAHNGHDKVVALLLDQGAEPNRVDKNGLFPLLQAAQNGHEQAVALLLEKGAEPNQVNEQNGLSPLLQAAQNGHEQAVAMLLEKGAEPDRANEQNGTFPLLMAAQHGHDQAVELLLDQGADPNRVHEKDGIFPLLMAAQNGHAKAVEMLLAEGADPNRVHEETGTCPLLQAAQEGHAKAVELLLARGADPNRVDEKDGLFPLLMAAHNGHAKAVELLLAEGVDPNRVHEETGTSPLLQAAHEGHAKVVELLLDQGADPNRVHEKNGNFPLLMAAHNGHDKVITRLLAKGADIDQRHEASGTTPLEVAIAAKKGSTATLLLDSGACKPPSILSRGDWPNDRVSEDAEQQKQTGQDTPANPAAAIPAFPIPGPWILAEVDERLQKGLSEILGKLLIPRDSVKGLLSRNLPLSGNDSLYLRQSCLLGVDQAGHAVAMDCLWLDGHDRFKSFLIAPGAPPLDSILEGLRDKSVLPDFRLPETRRTWAALAVLLGDGVLRTPLMQGDRLPLADGAAQPRFSMPEEVWREWKNRSGHADPYVELPWIEGRDLVWGKVLAPPGGVGLRVLAERKVLARDIDWAIPRFAVDENGTTLPFRYLGKIEQRQQ